MKRIVMIALLAMVAPSAGKCQFNQYLDNIHIAAIKSTHVESEGSGTFLRIVVQIVNRNDRQLRIGNGEFAFYLGNFNEKTRKLGSDQFDRQTILETNRETEVNDIEFKIRLGPDEKEVTETLKLILNTIGNPAEAKTIIYIDGEFHLGMKSDKGWTNIPQKINWRFKPDMQRHVLLESSTGTRQIEDKNDFLRYMEGPYGPKKSDFSPPDGMIDGLKGRYTQGETINIVLKAEDDTALKEMAFEVIGTPARKNWKAGGKTSTEKVSFPTTGWKPGTYHYEFQVTDGSGNPSKTIGEFELAAGDTLPDKTPPECGIEGINSEYAEGDRVEYTARMSDDRGLKRMRFEVKNTSIKEGGDISGVSVTRGSSFSTTGWQPGEYHYAYSVEDASGNLASGNGSFLVKARSGPIPPDKTDMTSPNGEISGIRQKYVSGEIVDYVLKASDDHLKQMTFEVEGTHVGEFWRISGDSVEKTSSFTTRGWESGTYHYYLQVIDESDNVKTVKGNFDLVQGSDTNPPRGSVTGIKPEYTEGDMVNCTIGAEDDQALGDISFDIPRTDIKQSWNVGGVSSIKETGFSTEGWKPGVYEYSVQLRDHALNAKVVSGSFLVRPMPVAEYVLFDYDSATIRPESFADLDKWGVALNGSLSDKTFTIAGHTCDIGSDKHNLELSEKRAKSVKDYLVNKHKVDPKRLLVKGYGKSRRLKYDNSPESRAKNRRIEFILEK